MNSSVTKQSIYLHSLTKEQVSRAQTTFQKRQLLSNKEHQWMSNLTMNKSHNLEDQTSLSKVKSSQLFKTNKLIWEKLKP